MTNGTVGIGRRSVLAGAAAAGAVMTLGAPAIRAQERSLKVGTYGGYFEDSFKKHIYPAFTKATGIKVDSVAEPTGEQWLLQLQQAAMAGQAPADVSMMANVPRIRGATAQLWAPLDEAKVPNAKNVMPTFLARYEGEKLYGVGAVSWFITLVTNTDVYKAAPSSWAALWDPVNRDRIGLLALASNSFLVEITAKTHFADQPNLLDSEEGIMKALGKLAEAKPNVKLWYRDEGQFQAQLQSGEIPMGQYYHDVAGLAAKDGHPVRSTFPKEGGVVDSGSWCVSKASKKMEEAQVFIDYMCQPAVQATLSREVGTAPVIPKALTGLSDVEFAAVSSETAPIIPKYSMYLERGDWLAQKWTEMITA